MAFILDLSMHHMRRLLLPLLLLAIRAEAQQTSVLFIGNSYTAVNDLPNTFRELALSLGDTVNVSMSAPGGYTFELHAAYAPTLAAIASQPWDFVVLQEQSQLGALPLDLTTTELGVIQLVQAIEANDECTWPVFYMTWGRENGDALNCPDFPFMCSYEGMQQGLRDNYVSLADSNDGYAAPVGVAWKQVRDTHPLIDLYQADESHPSPEGTYLAACVFYSALFQQSCVGASFNSTVQPDTAAILRNIASAIVLDSITTWNLGVPSGTDATITGNSSDAPNEITFYHPGQGTHLRPCSNGQSSTDANPTFTFAAPGIYTFTHTYTDPCGNTDTVTWTVEVYSIGMEEVDAMGAYTVKQIGPSMVEVTGGTGGEILTIADLIGRVLLTQRLDPGITRLTCPAGLHCWRIEAGSGGRWIGKILVGQ